VPNLLSRAVHASIAALRLRTAGIYEAKVGSARERVVRPGTAHVNVGAQAASWAEAALSHRANGAGAAKVAGSRGWGWNFAAVGNAASGLRAKVSTQFIFSAVLIACAFVAQIAVAAEAVDPAHAFAAPSTTTTPPPAGAAGIGQVTLALAVVLAAVFAAAWAMRRMRGFGNRVGNNLDVLANIPLGPKERAVLLKVGNQQVLIGVAAGRVNTLHVLPENIDISTSDNTSSGGGAETRPNFRDLLKRSLGK